MTTHPDCIFCKIIAGDLPSHQVWEDEKHLAFLTIFPNTKGVTVVIPKNHYPSYVFELPDPVYQDLLAAAKTVAAKLDRAFADTSTRCGLIFEGFGVDHVHAKLYPMHGTANLEQWQPIESTEKPYYEDYPGFMNSQDGERMDEETLAAWADRIRAA